jgi:DNA polymerase III subunit beta
MKIEINKHNLLRALTKADKITGKNISLAVLQCIVIKTLENQIEISATNLELGIKIYIPAKIERAGEVAVSSSLLVSYLNNLVQEEKLVLEHSDQTLKLIGTKSETQINTFSTTDFPSIPVIESIKKCVIESTDLIEGLKSVWYSASVSSIKPELSSVYLYSDSGELTFVATDSFRLAEKKPGAKIEDFESILIPQKNVSEIIRVFEGVESKIIIIFGQNQVSFEIEKEVYLISRVVDGVFPDYKQIVPKESKTEVSILKQDFINSLKISNLFSDNFNQVKFHLDAENNIFEITSKNTEKGESRTIVPASIRGESIDINFNQKYITECFNSIKTESFQIKFNGVGRPMVIKGVNEGGFMYLVMPLNK